MTQLYLYSTTHCHLCELAETQLLNLAEHYAFNWRPVEIVDDDDLLARYAVLIPVITDPVDHTELSWPFSTEDIVEKFNLKLR
jgi:hypothetical protein